MTLPVQKPGWAPQRGPQFAYFQCPVFELLFGGAAGGSKTVSLIFEAVTLCHKHPNYKAIIFRRSFPEIERSLVPSVQGLLSGICSSKDQGRFWTFPNGATLTLAHLQREEDKEKHKSAEYDFIAFDELTSFTESQYIYLFTRCRGVTNVPRYMRAASNPNGIGNAWVRTRFVDLPKDETGKLRDVDIVEHMKFEYAYGWRVDEKVFTNFSDLPPDFVRGGTAFEERSYPIYRDRKSGLERSFIPALLWANEKLIKADPEYIRRLRMQDEKTQDALLYGKWDVFEGQFFSEFDPAIHVVEPFVIPPEWKRFVGIDYGYSAPFAAVFSAVDNQGNVWTYREIYGTKMTTDVQAQTILESLAEDERIEWYAADPSMWSKSGVAETHAQMYHRNGVPILPSSNKRVAGWALMHEYLSRGKWRIFQNCTNLIRTLPLAQHSRVNMEDVDTTGDDHLLDAQRYLFTTLRGLHSNESKVESGDVMEAIFQERMRHSKRHKIISRIYL